MELKLSSMDIRNVASAKEFVRLQPLMMWQKENDQGLKLRSFVRNVRSFIRSRRKKSLRVEVMASIRIVKIDIETHMGNTLWQFLQTLIEAHPEIEEVKEVIEWLQAGDQ